MNAILPVTNLCDHLKTEPWQLAYDDGTKDFIYTAYAVSCPLFATVVGIYLPCVWVQDLVRSNPGERTGLKDVDVSPLFKSVQ